MSDTPPEEQQLRSDRVYSGQLVNLRVDDVRLPTGRETKREVVEHRGAVAMVPLLDDGRVILVRQWRYPVSEALLEIPAGTIEDGEKPPECAERELVEETGYAADTIKRLLSFYTTPGYTTESIDVFLCRDMHPKNASADEDENIQQVIVPWRQALQMATDGRITDGKTIAAILAADRIISQ